MKDMAVLLVTWSLVAAEAAQPSSATVILVVGAPGEADYGKQFAAWADRWVQAARRGGARQVVIGRGDTGGKTDRALLVQALQNEPKQGLHELWLVLIGHGTYDGRAAKFNLRGPDVSAAELAEWLQAFERPLAVIDCASSSAPFLKKLSATGRVVVTATRSGYELNFTRFGDFLSAGITDSQADLDKDGQTSLLEAYLTASRRVTEFYQTEARLATEHALLDDNGDGLGTPADWFRGIRAVRKAKDGASLDGYRAHQFHLVRSDRERNMSPELRAQRDQLELAMVKFRENKAQLDEDDYYQQLEPLLLALARLYRQIDDSAKSGN